MSSMIRRYVFAIVLPALALLLWGEQAQGQCRGSQRRQTRLPTQSALQTTLPQYAAQQQLQTALLASLQQTNALLAAVQQMQDGSTRSDNLVVALQQQQAALQAAVQQNGLVTASQLQSLRRQQAIVARQLRGLQNRGSQ